MDRYKHDLTHYSALGGKIGRLNTLSVIPVVAGDSFEAQIVSVVRLSPLRQALSIDARVDFYGFYIPYAQIDSAFVTFMEQGYDESQTLATDTLTATHYCLGTGSGVVGTIPKWLIAGYNRIWNRWFRVPNITTTERGDTDEGATAEDQLFGLEVAHLPSYLTPMEQPEVTTADYQLSLPVAGTATLDILDISRIKARYKTEIDRSYFGLRYDDIIKRLGGSYPESYADDRPELLFSERKWMSGQNVSGRAEGNLGDMVGRSEQLIKVNMPRKYFKEHGTVWIMAVVRYPVIVEGHSHYLVCNTQPSYKELSGDPAVINSEPPVQLYDSDFEQDLGGASTDDFGYYPYAQWYRTHPSNVHKTIYDLKGYPFLDHDDVSDATHDSRTYVSSEDYDKVFATTAGGHWQAFTKLNLNAYRIVPPALSSIYAGV